MAAPRRTFARGAKRLTTWSGPADQGYVAVASAGATLIASSTFAQPATVVRVRGQVSLQVATAADLSIVGAFGMGVVSQEAFNAGVASIPEPFSDGDWGGWFVWRSFSYRWEFSDASGNVAMPWNFEIDSKAMRKIEANEVIVFVAESQSGAFSISTPLRVLIKLH